MTLLKFINISKRGFKANPVDETPVADTSNTNKIWTTNFVKHLNELEDAEQKPIKIKSEKEDKIKLKKMKPSTFKESGLSRRQSKDISSSGGKSIFSGFWDFIVDEIAMMMGFKDNESTKSSQTKQKAKSFNQAPIQEQEREI